MKRDTLGVSHVDNSRTSRVVLSIIALGGVLAASLAGFASLATPHFEGSFDEAVQIMKEENGGTDWQVEEIFPDLDPHAVRGVSWWEAGHSCHWFLGEMDKPGNLQEGDEVFNDPRSAWVVATDGALLLARTHCDAADLLFSSALSTFNHLAWYK